MIKLLTDSMSGETPFLVYTPCLLVVSLTFGNSEEALLSLFYEDSGPIHEDSILMISSPPNGPHLLILSPTHEFGRGLGGTLTFNP